MFLFRRFFYREVDGLHVDRPDLEHFPSPLSFRFWHELLNAQIRGSRCRTPSDTHLFAHRIHVIFRWFPLFITDFLSLSFFFLQIQLALCLRERHQERTAVPRDYSRGYSLFMVDISAYLELLLPFISLIIRSVSHDSEDSVNFLTVVFGVCIIYINSCVISESAHHKKKIVSSKKIEQHKQFLSLKK